MPCLMMSDNMLHPDLSPPASNEEAVNSPKLDSPLNPHITSPDYATSPYHSNYIQKTCLQKTLSIESDICSPPSSTSSLKSPVMHPSPENDFIKNVATGVHISIGNTQKDNKTQKKDQCMICGDKAEKESFNILSCDSCRGFYKRAVKNGRKYTCIASKVCVLTKKTKNHCQYCRFTKCQKVGMNKEAVLAEIERDKKEKQLKKKNSASAAEATPSLSNPTMVDLNSIASAELFVDPKINNFANVCDDPIRQICLAADKQLVSLADWAKRLPHFLELSVLDQVKLLQWNWPELLIGGFCYRSSAVKDGILLSTGLHLSKANLEKAGVGTLVNKLFSEVINKMQKLQIDVSEWGCLRAIMLFAPDTKELKDIERVENIRDRYIATLCDYVRKTYPENSNRIGDLLLRLPPLKAIALQVLEHLFFFKLIGDVPIDTFLLEMLDVDNH